MVSDRRVPRIHRRTRPATGHGDASSGAGHPSHPGWGGSHADRHDSTLGAHRVTFITGRIGNLSDTPGWIRDVGATVRRGRSLPNLRPGQNLAPIVRGVTLPARPSALPHVILASAVAVVVLASQAFAQVPTSFPQGRHVNNFLQNRTNYVSSSGWDPAQMAVSDGNK